MNEHKLQVEHSLLQKAVRRGNIDVVNMTVKYLLSVGDSKWLKNRFAVLVYEECWPVGNKLTNSNILDQYVTLAQSVKNKDAAGLSTLAAKYHEGDWKALRGTKVQRDAITSVSNAIDNPDAFWEWARDNGAGHIGRINAAKAAVTKANFEADRAMMFAAAYFAAKDEVPLTANAKPQQSPEFPYWVAFDKHTDYGREVISEAAQKIDIYPSRARQLAFYLEGAICNDITISPYWQLAKDWRMEKMGYTYSQANIIWEQLKPVIIELTKKKAGELKDRIEKGSVDVGKGDQLKLI
jgi:hypothetical protein